MTFLRSALTLPLASALLLAGASAWAQSGGTRVLAVSAAVVSPNATYSREGLPNGAAWRVKLSNTGPNTINGVVFRATTRVLNSNTGLATGSVAPWTAVDPAVSCKTTNAAPATVECTIGQLRAAGLAGSTSEFVLFFRTPANVNGVPERIVADWRAEYSDRSRGERIDLQTGSATGAAVLDEDTARDQYKGAIAPAGTKSLFTGAFAGAQGPAATAGDPWVTFVLVPPFTSAYGGDYTASIFETENIPPLRGETGGNRMQSELTIPGRFAELKITLRRDVSALPAVADVIAYVVQGGLKYQYVDTACTAAGNPESSCTITNLVYKCSVVGGPTPKAPCIDDADPKGLYIFTAADGLGAEWTGDLQIKVRAVDNGRYIN